MEANPLSPLCVRPGLSRTRASAARASVGRGRLGEAALCGWDVPFVPQAISGPSGRAWEPRARRVRPEALALARGTVLRS